MGFFSRLFGREKTNQEIRKHNSTSEFRKTSTELLDELRKEEKKYPQKAVGYEQRIEKEILGEIFIFDKITLRLFNEEFSSGGYEIVIDNGYLGRIKGNMKYPQHFHRWYMLRKKPQEDWGDYEIHHKNRNKKDNRWGNLKLHEKERHREIHENERNQKRFSKAYQTFKRKYLETNPLANGIDVNEAWGKFKKKHNIAKYPFH